MGDDRWLERIATDDQPRCEVEFIGGESRTRCLLRAGHQSRGRLMHLSDVKGRGRWSWINEDDPEYIMSVLASIGQEGTDG